MRSRLGLAVAALAILALPGCRKSPAHAAAGAPSVPKGDVVWLTDPAAASDSTLDAQLGRLGAVALFLPAGTLGAAAGPRSLEPGPPPARPLEHVPVVLVLAAGEELAASLSTSDGPDEALGGSAAPLVARVMTGGAYGKVAGVHLDLPLAPRSAARYAALVKGLRRGLPAGTFVSISLPVLASTDEDRKKMAPLYEAADALVAFVFGRGPRVDTIATDALGRPWWAAYDVRAEGEILDATGPRGTVPERLVEPLSGNSRFQFENDLSVNDAAVSAFTLTARAPIKQDGLTLEPGDRVAFRVPAISEMLFQLGSNLAGKRHALGRALLFGGASEADRLFDLGALEDVLLGRPLAPGLEASVRPAGRGAITVDLVNHTHHASVASRVDNWVEIDVAPAHPAEVQIGGFDRYEVYDHAGQPVTPGRATRVRLYETLVAPLEVVTPARIIVRGTLPAACCPSRFHAMSAAGPEVSSDWINPPPPPTPEPKKAPPPARRR